MREKNENENDYLEPLNFTYYIVLVLDIRDNDQKYDVPTDDSQYLKISGTT